MACMVGCWYTGCSVRPGSASHLIHTAFEGHGKYYESTVHMQYTPPALIFQNNYNVTTTYEMVLNTFFSFSSTGMTTKLAAMELKAKTMKNPTVLPMAKA